MMQCGLACPMATPTTTIIRGYTVLTAAGMQSCSVPKTCSNSGTCELRPDVKTGIASLGANQTNSYVPTKPCCHCSHCRQPTEKNPVLQGRTTPARQSDWVWFQHPSYCNTATRSRPYLSLQTRLMITHDSFTDRKHTTCPSTVNPLSQNVPEDPQRHDLCKHQSQGPESSVSVGMQFRINTCSFCHIKTQAQPSLGPRGRITAPNSLRYHSLLLTTNPSPAAA